MALDHNEPIKIRVSYRLKANLGDYEQAEVMVEFSGVSHLAKDSDVQQAHLKAHEMIVGCANALTEKIKDARAEAKTEFGLRAQHEREVKGSF